MSAPPPIAATCPHCHSPLGRDTGGVCLHCLGERALRSGTHLAGDSFSPGIVLTTTEDRAVRAALGAAALPLPRQFGDYEILEELGRGGMGSVFLARQIELNRLVALKVIAGGQFATAEAEARFQRETQTIALLHHPNIVAIHAAGRHDGQLFYAMDFVDGIDLGRACAVDPLEPREAAQILAAVARGVQHAHERGIIHRDLKPSNILLDAAGVPRVADFGIAQWTFEPAGLTRTGQILGSPAFMPPEQAAGVFSPAVDIYALGAVLHFALTGHAPFAATNALEVFAQIAREPAPAPSARQSAVPAALDAICLRALEKKPGDRFPSAAEFAAELERWLAGEELQTTYAPVAEARRIVEDVRAQIRRQGYYAPLCAEYADKLGRAGQLAPTLADAQTELAKLHMHLFSSSADPTPARRDLARLCIERAEALDPAGFEARSARIFYRLNIEGRRRETMPLLRELMRERADDPLQLTRYAHQCAFTGWWAEGRRALQRAVELEPASALPRHILAHTLFCLREYDDAALWIRQAAQIDDSSMFRRLMRLWFGWLADPDSDRALRDFHALPEADRKDRVVVWCKSQFLLAQRRFSEALAAYRAAEPEPASSFISQIDAAAYLLRLERWAGDAGAAETEAALRNRIAPGRQKTPTNQQYMMALAHAHAALGNRTQALALADDAANAVPFSQNAYQAARVRGANEFLAMPGRLLILALLDERDRFFSELEVLINVPAAVDPRYLAMDPTFDALRTDPRFDRIMATVQIPIRVGESVS